MDDLSLHLLDIAENAIEAGATRVEIRVMEDPQANRLTMEVRDNGRGMDAAMARAALDPFVTTKLKPKAVGLGLPLLAQAAREAGGDLKIESAPGQGACVSAEMLLRHIDRKPLGDLAATIAVLIIGHPEASFHYAHTIGQRRFAFASEDFRADLGSASVSSPETIRALKQTLKNGEDGLK